VKLSGWGRYPVADCRLSAPRDAADLCACLDAGPGIARGNGRAYGDSAMNASNTISMRHFNRMIAFDPETGQLITEAGVILGDVIRTFLPRGWFPPVTPGTKFVTIGGMIAADVHGKNHHCDGSFGNFVDWIEVIGPGGEMRRTAPGEALFEWTVGGMGLTGLIVRAAVRLTAVETGWIRQRTLPAPTLAATMDTFETAQDATYSVAWIDCLSTGARQGRSLVMLGEHAALDELPPRAARRPHGPPARRARSVPADLPGFVLNRAAMRAFNALYYRNGCRKAGTGLVGWDPFFYPLDSILGWNRIYGRRGFVQFQCVLPLAESYAGLSALLDAVAAAGQGAFLSVLKRFGTQESRFSFPMEGYTLALDFPVSRRSLAMMERLDEITVTHGGRFYLAKDGRLKPDTLHSADPRAAAFRAMRQDTGLAREFSSRQSERVQI